MSSTGSEPQEEATLVVALPAPPPMTTTRNTRGGRRTRQRRPTHTEEEDARPAPATAAAASASSPSAAASAAVSSVTPGGVSPVVASAVDESVTRWQSAADLPSPPLSPRFSAAASVAESEAASACMPGVPLSMHSPVLQPMPTTPPEHPSPLTLERTYTRASAAASSPHTPARSAAAEAAALTPARVPSSPDSPSQHADSGTQTQTPSLPASALSSAIAAAPPPTVSAADSLLDDAEPPAAIAVAPPVDFQLGFSSGHGRPVAISDAALRRAEQKMQSHDDEPDPAPAVAAEPPPNFQLGFSSGAGKRIAISAAAIKRAEAKLASAEEERSPPPSPQQPAALPPNFQLGFSSGLGRPVATSAAAVQKAQSNYREAEDTKMDPTPESKDGLAEVPPDFQLGFSSGAGKRIAISAAAIKRAEAKLADDEQPPETVQPAAPPSNFQLGFSSGRGSRLNISAAALKQAEAKMAALEDDQPPAAQSAAPPSGFQLGFSSGSGSRLNISAAALKQAEAKMAALHEDATPMNTDEPAQAIALAPSTDTFSGFGKFSGGQFVAQQFTPQALEKAKAFMRSAEQEGGDLAPPIVDETHEPVALDSSDAFATPASKRRKSNFSTALPMPTLDDDADSLMSTPAGTPLEHIVTPAPQPQPTPKQHVFQTPAQPLRPLTMATPSSAASTVRAPSSAASLAAPSSAMASAPRKRAFVSPRVTNKAATALLPPTPAAVNLLSVHRPHNNNANGHSSPADGAHQQPQLPAAPLPSLGVPVSMPVASTDSKKLTLRQFATACQAKIDWQQEQSMAPPPVHFVQHTSIPVEFITSLNASLVLFIRPEDAERMDGQASEPSLGWLDVRTSLLSLGLPSSLCSIAWVRNHFRWVVWKLASYQRRFGSALAQPACTYERVVRQLYGRYERELNQVKTPALKKILEGDDAAGKFLILMVAQVVGVKQPPVSLSGRPPSAYWVDDSSGAIPTRPGGCEVELCDGWYSVWCKLDQQLFYQMQHGKLYPGQKLRIWGAQLAGPMPTTPLENSETFMKIQINSVRRAYWHSPLGVQRSLAFLVNLASLRPDGGLVPAIKVAVSKQYPMLFLHPANVDPNAAAAPPSSTPNADGTAPARVRKLHCNERSHDMRMRLHERFCEQRVEKLQAAYMDRQMRPQKEAKTREQVDAEAEEWDRERSELEAELQDVMKQVTPYLKLHLCELTDQGATSTSDIAPVHDGAFSAAPLRWSGQCCSFTVWRPGDDHRELLIPGREFIIFGCAVHTRYKPMSGRVSPMTTTRPSLDSLPSSPHQSCIAASSTFLQLSTSRMTNIVPHALRKAKGAAATPLTSASVPLRTEFLRSPLFMRPNELLSLPRGAEFDCVCLVLWSNDEGEAQKLTELNKPVADPSKPSGGGRWLRTRRLLCVGMSGEMMVVEVKESEEVIHFTQAIQTPQLMVMENLHYTMYEKKLRLHSVASSVVSRFLSKGVVQLDAPAPLSSPSHSVYAHPSIAQFQTWLSQSATAHLYEIVSELSRRIMDGSWNRDQPIITFNKDEFNHLPCFDVSGHVHPIDGPTSLTCTKSLSLDRLLPAAAQTHSNGADQQPIGDSSHSLLKKRALSSLLAPSAKGAEVALSKADQNGNTTIDCIAASASSTPCVCYHPCHTLSHLLDAIHCGILVLVDDAVRRWPLQLDSCSFRRLLHAIEPPSASSQAEENSSAPASLVEWWHHLVSTGDVPHLDFGPIVPQQHALQAALTQLRKHTFQQITQKLQMDEAHQKAQFADWVSAAAAMLVLSHSTVAPSASYLDASTSAFLSSVAPSWCASSAPPRTSPEPLLDAQILFSPTHGDQVRVAWQCTPTHEDDIAPVVHMDTTNEELASPEVSLTPTQLSQLRELLASSQQQAAEAQPNTFVPNGPSTPTPSLFHFTSLEWRALCQHLSASLTQPALAFQLAECERFTPNLGVKTIASEASSAASTSFKSVFLPKADTIRLL